VADRDIEDICVKYLNGQSISNLSTFAETFLDIFADIVKEVKCEKPLTEEEVVRDFK
jgi:predicted methyltransferase